MIKLILAVAIPLITGLTLLGKRYLSRRAKKERLLGNIREVEDEMGIHAFGSLEYNQLDHKLQQLNQEYADNCRNE